jgi:hypothetical protein
MIRDWFICQVFDGTIYRDVRPSSREVGTRGIVVGSRPRLQSILQNGI